MLEFLSQNIGSIIVLFVIVAIMGALIFGLIRSKKRGGSSCGCGCSNCPMSKSCNRNQK